MTRQRDSRGKNGNNIALRAGNVSDFRSIYKIGQPGVSAI